jgi:hypothetical protein
MYFHFFRMSVTATFGREGGAVGTVDMYVT